MHTRVFSSVLLLKVAALALAYGLAATPADASAPDKFVKKRVWFGATMSVPKGTKVTRVSRNKRNVRLPASFAIPGSSMGPVAFVDRVKIGEVPSLAAFANSLRQQHRRSGYKRITVRARPAQGAIQERYYVPPTAEWRTSKYLLLGRGAAVQAFYPAGTAEFNSRGGRALRKVVNSLAPAP